ncbi:MAG: hypothetical protein CMJ89_19035 [Planctomycetes bacterium]|nr:hypothetical protein [Planctomycetota bacterium]
MLCPWGAVFGWRFARRPRNIWSNWSTPLSMELKLRERSSMTDARSWGLALVLCLSAACSTRIPPPPGAGGAEIYRLQNCANCHGGSGEGNTLGPALKNLNKDWNLPDLVSFLADPGPFLAKNGRLATLRKAYPAAMSRYDNLDADQLGELARWLLEL